MFFIHGFSGSRHSFEPVFAHLPPSIHAFALTQRGHGDASKPERGYTLDVFATDAMAFMDAVGLDSAIVVGHSMGSAVALRMALDYPKRVQALVLIGAGPLAPGGPKERAFWETTVSKLKDPLDPNLVRSFLETVYARPIPEETFESALRNSLKVPARVWRAMWKSRLEGRGTSGSLSEIGVPTLIIWGDQDRRCTRDEQDALLDGIPNARLEIYEGVGHSPYAEAPERLASDIAAFANEALSRSDTNSGGVI